MPDTDYKDAGGKELSSIPLNSAAFFKGTGVDGVWHTADDVLSAVTEYVSY